MAEPILSRFPNLTGLLQTRASIESGLGGVASALRAIGEGQPGAPLGPVIEALQGVNDRLTFDTSGLTARFPQALTVMRNAVPPASLESVRSIDAAYTQARDFLGNTPWAREVGEGRSLQEVALAVVSDILQTFEARQLNLARNLIDPTALQNVTNAFTAITQFRSDFDAHRGAFLPFLSQNLLGVAPDLLRGPLDHLAQSQSVLAPLQPAAVEAALGPSRQAATAVFGELLTAISTMDPTDLNSYVRINALLDSLATAIRSLHDAVAPLYTQARTLIDAHPWDTLFVTHRALLEAIALDNVPTIDGVIQSIASILESVLVRLQSIFGPQDLAERIERLSLSMQELFLHSPLGQVRGAIQDFLADIRRAIEAVPLEQITQAVESMLNRVRQEIEALGFSQIGDTVEQAFRDLESFVTQQIGDALTDQVQAAIQALVSNLHGLPVHTLVSSLNQAIAQVEALIGELEESLQGGLDRLSQVLTELEELSFKPVGDAVTGEINEVRTRLQRINPNALSDAEKLAIRGAVALLQEIDLDDVIQAQVKRRFHTGKDALLSIVDQIIAALGVLRDRVNGFDPQQLMGALTGLLAQARQAVDGLDARLLLRPLHAQLDEFARRLQAVSPGALLTPLEQPYQAVRSAINQLNPDQLVAPLNGLYMQIETLLGHVDVTPVLDELDRRQRELFANIRQSWLSALDDLSLPEPLSGLLDAMRQVLEALTEAIFQDPDAEVRRISLDLSTRFCLRSLFEPLDRAFDELTRMLTTVPENDLVEAINGMRTGVGVGLEAIDPRRILERFRAGQVRLAELSPRLLFAVPLGLSSLKAAFQVHVATAPDSAQGPVSTTLARFDATFQVIDPTLADSLVSQLTRTHAGVEEALRRRVNSLNTSGADEAYGRLRANLDRVVPPFLRGEAPLSYPDSLAGIQSLRPSRKAEELERIFDRFLAHLRPMQAALEPAVNGFFGSLRNTIMLLNPLSLKDAVADIYAAIRERMRLLDPARLASSLRNSVFDPLIAMLDDINPAELRARLDGAFQAAMQAVTANIRGILDDIAVALQAQLQEVKTALQSMIGQIDRALLSATETFSTLVGHVEALVFGELLGRLRRVVEALGVSFDRELDRVRKAFDEMLAAIPLGGGASAAVGGG